MLIGINDLYRGDHMNLKTKTFFLLLLLSTSVLAIDLTLNISNIEKLEGTLKISLTDKAEGFPENTENTIREEVVAVDKNEMQVTFFNLEQGEYAVSLFHDLNDDGELKKRPFFGVFGGPEIPDEPFGFSNNPRLLGKPKYEDCKFKMSGNRTFEIQLQTL